MPELHQQRTALVSSPRSTRVHIVDTDVPTRTLCGWEVGGYSRKFSETASIESLCKSCSGATPR